LLPTFIVGLSITTGLLARPIARIEVPTSKGIENFVRVIAILHWR
jgi:hypothetical protein